MASSTPTQSPNLHPNAIKTTSTGVLTRSNSSKAHGSWASHKYVPVPSPSAFVFDSPTSSPSPRHRHMKSSSDAQKSPSNKSYRLESAQRSERSYSMSPSPTKYSRSWVGKDPQGEQIKLPRHPYLWTPAHLATYLSFELCDSEGEPLDPEVVRRMVAFVQEQKIGGRAFLSFDQEDFQEMEGVTETWCHAFWDASCTLRRDTTPYRPSRVSSASFKPGRVRGIVDVFERSASESSDVGEDDAPSRSLSEVDFRPGLPNRKSSRQIRIRAWSGSESGDEKSGRTQARYSRPRRSATQALAEREMLKSPLQSSPASTLDNPTDPNTSLNIRPVPNGNPFHADDSPGTKTEDGMTVIIPLHPETPPHPMSSLTERQNRYLETPGSDLLDDKAPSNREVEIMSVRGREESELSMAELYEEVYGVPPPTRSPHLESPIGETVKLTTAALPTSPPPPVIRHMPGRAKLSPPLPSLAQLFVPSALPEQAGREPQTACVLPVQDSESSEVALRTLDMLKSRLEVVERRLKAIEEKDAGMRKLGVACALPLPHNFNKDAFLATGEPLSGPGPRPKSSRCDDAIWADRGPLRTRQSVYILLAGAGTGISAVLIPILLRHFWTR